MKNLLVGLALLFLASSTCSAQVGLRDLQGHSVTFEQLFSHPETQAVVFVVWCSHCGSCRSLEKELTEYSKAGSPEVKVYALDPHPSDSAERVRAFLAEQKLELPVLLDPSQAFTLSLRIDRTTTTLVYDRERQLRYFGPFRSNEEGYAKAAVQQVISGGRVETTHRPLRGCPIPRLPFRTSHGTGV